MTRRLRVRDLPPKQPSPPQETARSAAPLPPSSFSVPEEATPQEEFATAVPAEFIPEAEDLAEIEKARLARAKRDSTGFITDALPHVTSQQLRWLTYRLESGDDREACDLSGTDPYQILSWMADPGFRATYESALDNKREGFKTLTSHLLPSVIRSLQEMLDKGNMKDKKEASALILRAQGLMVDKSQSVDPNAIQGLFALLREERPVEARILDVKSFRIEEDRSE